jgi:hypothetical protein
MLHRPHEPPSILLCPCSATTQILWKPPACGRPGVLRPTTRLVMGARQTQATESSQYAPSSVSAPRVGPRASISRECRPRAAACPKHPAVHDLMRRHQPGALVVLRVTLCCPQFHQISRPHERMTRITGHGQIQRDPGPACRPTPNDTDRGPSTCSATIPMTRDPNQPGTRARVGLEARLVETLTVDNLTSLPMDS